MKHLLLIVVVVGCSLQMLAQEGHKSRHVQKKRTFDVENFKKEKADFIISEANLTSSEASVFIPIMDELVQKKFELNRKVRNEGRLLKNKKNPSTTDYDNYLKLSIQTKIEEALLDKEYYDKFRKILTPEKIYRYQQAESRFIKEIVNKDMKKK